MHSNMRSPEEIEHTMKAFESLPEDVDGLLEKLSDPDEEVRGAAASRLMWQEDQRIVPALLQALDDESYRARGAAIRALGHLKAQEAVPALIRRLNIDTSPYVRWVCILSLASIGGEEAVGRLKLALKDADPQVRRSSCYSIERCTSNPPIDDMFKLLNDPEWQVRYAACDVLTQLGVGDKRLVQAIVNLHEIAEAREQARTFAEANAIMQVVNEHPEVVEMADKVDPEMAGEDLLEFCRRTLGADAVPSVSEDPLLELARQAEAHLTAQE